MSAVAYESIPDQPDGSVLHRRFDDGESRFEIALGANFDTHVVVAGRGTLGGARALLGHLDEVVARIPAGQQSRVYVDMSDNRGGPLRGQLLFGKWLFKHRHRIARGVVVGARALDRRLATGALRVARLRNVRFFEHDVSARAWLSESR